MDTKTKEYIARFTEIHGDTYDYSKVKVVNDKTPVTIICQVHGEFEQRPHSHKRGRGCPKCAKQSTNKTTEEFITEAHKVHGDKYDYSKVHYKQSKEPVTITCHNCGHTFDQTPNVHLSGKGCPKCAKSGIKENKPVRLYYLRIEKDGEVAFKYGITNRTVKRRYTGEMGYITVIAEKVFKDGTEAIQIEREIKEKFSDLVIEKKILKTGHTETLKKDVFSKIQHFFKDAA